MNSVPGHHQVFECIGTVLLLHTRKGTVHGALVEVAVDDEPPLRIAVVAQHPWPDVAPGDILWVKGRLRLEPLALGRRNTHFVDVIHRDHLTVVGRGPAGRHAEETHAVLGPADPDV
jgi:hypothetical protein